MDIPAKTTKIKISYMVPVYGDCESDPRRAMKEKRRSHISQISWLIDFFPFNFLAISGYPHPVLDRNEWDDYLPRFRGSKHDNPGKHLLKFHVCMLEHGFFHEDV
jgi:hypothetical protein